MRVKYMKKIEIRNFGPLSDVNLRLDKSLQVIIGPQASGKSTIVKMIYFCRKIRDYLIDYAQQITTSYPSKNEVYANFLRFLRKPFMGCFGTTKHMENFRVQYYYDELSNKYVEISLDADHYVRFKFSDKIANEIRRLLADALEIVKSNVSHENLVDSYLNEVNFINTFRRETYRLFADEDKLLYIPAGRNMLATIPDLLQSNITGFDSISSSVDITRIDLITQDFISYIRQMRKTFGSKLDEIKLNYLKTETGAIRNHDVDLACELIRKILKADYISDSEGEKLFYDDQKWVKLMFGSSGQQEVLWALNVIFLAILKGEKTFLVFEEPESHIFPDAQFLAVELVALMINSSKSQVFLTTHSPYLLTATNLLIYSGKIEGNSKNTSIIEKRYRLTPDSVAAYMIPESKSKFKDLISAKNGLIDAAEIDHISDDINSKMDELIEMDLQ